MRPLSLRYAWPAEIDLMARLAGLDRIDRWSGWGGTPFDAAQYYRVDAGRIRTGLVAAQWVLVDHPPDAGGFVCIPGSHRSSFTLPATFDRELAVEVPMAAGDVVVFSEALTHGTLRVPVSAAPCACCYRMSVGHCQAREPWRCSAACATPTPSSPKMKTACQPAGSRCVPSTLACHVAVTP